MRYRLWDRSCVAGGTRNSFSFGINSTTGAVTLQAERCCLGVPLHVWYIRRPPGLPGHLSQIDGTHGQSTGFHSSANLPTSSPLPSKFIFSSSFILSSLSGGRWRTSRFSFRRAGEDVLACGQYLWFDRGTRSRTSAEMSRVFNVTLYGTDPF
jgi:hypothetical protein